MKREWKPGDVALVTLDGTEFVAVRGHSLWADAWFIGGPKRGSQHGWPDSQLTNIRPLVVIDPEDREQVERLIRALSTGRPFIGLDPANREMVDAAWMTHTQAALRSLIEPPRPEEPTGLGAVVEVDSTRAGLEGEKMRLVRSHASWSPWLGDDQKREWDDIPGPITVLSEGVPS